jgi:acyl-CoA synthetase (AMP-forming)/AMP-acid ligase II
MTTEPVRIRRLPDVLRVSAHVMADSLAHVDETTELTFGDWDRLADEIGGGLASAGIEIGDRVLLPITNRHAAQMAATFIGVQRAGAICVPVNTRLAVSEVEAFRELVGSRVAITDLPELPRRLSLDRWFSVDDVPRDAASVPDQAALPADADADIIGTSGTTGRPKGVVFSHAELIDGLDGCATNPSKIMLHALPFSGYGGCHGVMMLPLRIASTVVTQPKFEPAGFLALIESKRPTSLQLVPAMLRLLVDHPASPNADVSSVRWIFTGTAPLPSDTVARLAELWPWVRLINVYGMTEGSSGTQTAGRESVHKAGSVGTPREAGTVEIRDDRGDQVGVGEVGEIWTRMKHPRRYWNDPEATAATWPGNWLRTGDRGYVDADGDLILVGRSKELIIRGGYNIAPVEIEEVLHAHPDVREAAVLGVPHDVLGEDVAAAVVARDGSSVEEAELIAWCRERLADNKVPRVIVVLNQLPYNQNAKVLKRELVASLTVAAQRRRERDRS